MVFGIFDIFSKKKNFLEEKEIKYIRNLVELNFGQKEDVGLCGYYSSIVTGFLQTKFPSRNIKLGFGFHIDRWGNSMHHYYTIVDNKYFIDFTYRQFDETSELVLIGKIKDLWEKYNIINFENEFYQDFENKMQNLILENTTLKLNFNQNYRSVEIYLKQFKLTIDEFKDYNGFIVPSNEVKKRNEIRNILRVCISSLLK